MHSKVEAHSWRTGKRGEERSIAAQRRKARRGETSLEGPLRVLAVLNMFSLVFLVVWARRMDITVDRYLSCRLDFLVIFSDM